MIITFITFVIMTSIVTAMLITSGDDHNEKIIQYLMKTYGWSHEQATAEFEIFNGHERKQDM